MKTLSGLYKRLGRSLDRGMNIHRFLTSLIYVCTVELLISGHSFKSFDYFNGLDFKWHIFTVAVLFFLFSCINNRKLDQCLLIISATFYCAVAGVIHAIFDGSPYFAFGCCIFLGAVFLYAYPFERNYFPDETCTRRIIFILGTCFVIFVGGLTVLRYKSHHAPCYDFGIFSQMFHYMKEDFRPFVTCERDGLLSHFAVHFSPIYYLLLPLYLIFPEPSALLAGQALVLASGLWPLYLLGRKYDLSKGAAIAVAALYVLLPSTIGGSFFFLHENKFLLPLLLWLFYCFEQGGTFSLYVVALLVMLVKEDAPVYVAFFALYLIISKRGLKKGAILFGLSVAYFLSVTTLMGMFGEGIMNYRYENYIYDGGGSLFTVIKAIFLNPVYVILQCFTGEKLVFMLQMLLPLGFLPCLIKKPSRTILLLPMVLFNLMSNYYYQHDIGYQYTYGSAAFLFYLLLLNYSAINSEIRRRILVVALSSSFVLFCNIHLVKLNSLHYYITFSEERQTIDTALEMIPGDASVAAGTFLVPALFDHKLLYELETTEHKTEYIAVDLRYPERYSSDQYRTEEYETVYYAEGIIAVYKQRKSPSYAE